VASGRRGANNSFSIVHHLQTSMTLECFVTFPLSLFYFHFILNLIHTYTYELVLKDASAPQRLASLFVERRFREISLSFSLSSRVPLLSLLSSTHQR